MNPADTTQPELFRALVEQSPDALIFADPEGNVRVWNVQAQAMFGYTAAEAIGQNLDFIIPEHLRARHWEGYARAIAAGRTRPDARPMLTRATHKDGSKLYAEFAFGIVTDGQCVLGALATARPASKP
ncbi:MAG: PAS domain S-box protein [Betaproteobacteria bacterium]|nr:PAS domain S-box protein [Betaproteobacteria bacterium]